MDNTVSALKTDLEGQLNQTREELRVAQESLEQSMRTQREAKTEKDNLSRQLQDFQAKLDEANNAKTRLERQNRALQDEMETLSEEIESNVMDKFEEMKNSHNRAINEHKAAIEAANSNARTFEDKHRNATTENEAIRGQLEEATARAQKLEGDHSATKAQLEDARRKHEDEIQSHQRTQKEAKKLSKALKQAKADLLEAENKVPEAELRRVTELTQDLQLQLEEAQRATALAQKEKESLNSDLSSLRLELEEEQRAKQQAMANAK